MYSDSHVDLYIEDEDRFFFEAIQTLFSLGQHQRKYEVNNHLGKKVYFVKCSGEVVVCKKEGTFYLGKLQ